MLQALARCWRVDPASEAEPMVGQLVEAMHTSSTCQQILATCSPQAHKALALLLENPAGLPSHRLTVNYGHIRKLGPAGMLREAPWAKPESVLEELFYKGLIYRAYGNVSGGYGEVLWVPEELAANLVQTDTNAPLEREEPGPIPDVVRSNERVVSEDILALLVQAKVGKFKELHLNLLNNPALKNRLVGGTEPGYLSFIERLVGRSRLLTEAEGYLQPSARARSWMRAEYPRQLAALYIAWRDNPMRDELVSLGLNIEGGKQPQLNKARKNLCAFLGKCLPGKWYSLDAFIANLQSDRPDYMRTDGDYDAWSVTTNGGEQTLRGYTSWAALEGAFARYLVSKPLYWLGIVSLGSPPGDADSVIFTLNQTGSEILHNRWKPGQLAAAIYAAVDDNFLVTIQVQDTLYERFQLERFSTWQSQSEVAQYLISERSVWEGVNAGIAVEQMLRFLERICAGKVSAVVKRALHAWGGHFGRASLQKAVILQVADAEVMVQILHNTELRRLLGAEISPTQRLVPLANLAVLIERLKQVGIWPTLKL